MFESILVAAVVLVSLFIYLKKKGKKEEKKLVKKQSRSNIPEAYSKPETMFKVVTVIDGDTYMLCTPEDTTFKVRVLGIDAPESHKSEKKDVEYYGAEAFEYAKSVLLKKYVRIEYDTLPLDQFNRHLVYIYLEDNTFWNEHMIEKGYARLVAIRPNVKYQARLQKAESIAREKRIGMWQKHN